MLGVDMRGLIDRCGSVCTRALHRAAELSVGHTHYEVTFEHFLISLLEDATSDQHWPPGLFAHPAGRS